jgi:hypothetical protein
LRNTGVLQYLYSDAVFNTNSYRGVAWYNISINATANSTLPPIINAVEVFSVIATTNADDKEVKAWRFTNDCVMAVIFLNVDLSIHSCLKDRTTAKEIWDYLRGRYQQSISTLRYSIHQNLHCLQQ